MAKWRKDEIYIYRHKNGLHRKVLALPLDNDNIAVQTKHEKLKVLAASTATRSSRLCKASEAWWARIDPPGTWILRSATLHTALHARIYRLVMKLECPSILCPLYIALSCLDSVFVLDPYCPASLSIDPNMNFFLLWSKQWQAHAPNGRANTGVFHRLVHGLRKLTSWGATLQTSYTTWVRRESTVVAQYCAYLCGIQYTVYFERSSQSLKNYSASFTFMQPLLVYTHARHLQAGMHSNNPPILVVAEEGVTSNN